MSESRANVTESRVRKWFSVVREILGDDTEILNDPQRVYNVDEMAFFLAENGTVVLAEHGKPVYNVNKNSDKEYNGINLC